MRAAPTPVPQFFAAMQAGAPEADRLLALFTDDAEYEEPFSGEVQTHHGVAAIRRAWEQPLPDLRIAVDRVDVEGDEVIAHWTCFSPALPGGRGSGVNRFELDGGRIRRLVTTLAPE